jgi:hypothetical protein
MKSLAKKGIDKKRRILNKTAYGIYKADMGATLRV